MVSQELRAESNIAVADWIAPRMRQLSTVAGTAPAGYEAYVRLCHPAYGRDRLYFWTEVAGETGRIAHPVMQWHALVGASDSLNMTDSTWDGGDPQRGNLEPSVLRALSAILREHTETPRACLFGLWDGYGFIDGGSRMTAYPVASGREGSVERVSPAFSRDRPTLVLPVREYFLFRGPIEGAIEMGERWGQSPNLLWPEDRAWFVASEIDFDSTVIGGSPRLAQALLEAAELDAWPVDPDDLLSDGADEINLISTAD